MGKYCCTLIAPRLDAAAARQFDRIQEEKNLGWFSASPNTDS